MSITFGNLINETINDNRFKLNTYYNSNCINLNLEEDTYKNAIINFKNKSQIGYSNNNFAMNTNDFNFFNASHSNSIFNNDLYVKSNFFTSNSTTFLNSNITFNLYNNPLNDFKIINSNLEVILKIDNDTIEANYNNTNKLTIHNYGVAINDDITIKENKSLFVRNLKAIEPTKPILIDNAIITNLNMDGFNLRKYVIINNNENFNEPSISINRFKNDCNIIELSSKTSNNLTGIINSNKIFTINNEGYIGISREIPKNPIDIKIISSNTKYILSYYGDHLDNYFNNSNTYSNDSNLISSNQQNFDNLDKFVITNRGFIGIGTDNTSNHLLINIKDDNRNNINYPIINLNFNYNSSNNYKTSNLINLKFIAEKELRNIYDENDSIIGTTNYEFNNFNFTFTSNSSFFPQSVEPVQNARVVINASNMINNDYIITNNISNLVNYTTSNYSPFLFNYNNVDYIINYHLEFPEFLKLDKNEIMINNNQINPTIIQDNINPNFYNLTYTSYIIKENSIKPYDETSLILKEYKREIYTFDPINETDFAIYLNQRLFIERNIYELKSFMDWKTYTYQPPSLLLYASSNENFSASLTADGRLSLGDTSLEDNYYLYINKKARLNNLECLNLSSVPNKKNINFSLCNISNINRCFTNSNINDYQISTNAIITNLFNTSANISNINVSNINVSLLNFTNEIIGSNISISSNLAKFNMRTSIGSNYIYKDDYLMDININSINSNGLIVQSDYSNLNPSIVISGNSPNNYPYLRILNNSIDYSIGINSNINKNYLNYDNFYLKDNKNNRIIFKHINYNDNNNNQLILGNSNNIIFDLKQEPIPTNETNKISLGYPYRYLLQNSFSIYDWDKHFKENLLNSDCMLNVYGNINLSSINNTPFIKCIATEYPYEKVSINIGGAQSKPGFIMNVEGNTYFSSNINIQNDIYVRGTLGNVSDIRFKEKLEIIKNSVEKIEKISGYTYNRKDTGRRETGLVAQEVLEILPEAINKDNDDYYNISYGNMSGLLVEGIKELNERIKRIENYLFYN